jgi:ElaB/YqjD/DUF883 family membrane-anchored ribosome-binding protein
MNALSDQSSRLAENVQSIGKLAARRAGRTLVRLGEGKRYVVRYVNRKSDQVREYIHDYPVRSTAIALGIGAVLGFLLRRRK